MTWREGDIVSSSIRSILDRWAARGVADDAGDLRELSNAFQAAAREADELTRRETVYRDTIRRQNRDFERKIQELSILRRIGDLIAGSLKVDDLLDRVLDVLVQELHVENSSVMILDPASGDLSVETGRGPGAPAGGRRTGTPAFRVGEGIAGWVAASREPLIVADVRRDVRFQHVDPADKPTGALVCVPLVAEDRVLGVLNLSTSRKGAFDSHDLHILRIVASQIAGALIGRDLYRDLQELSGRLEDEVSERTRELQVRTADLHRKNEQVTQLYFSLEKAQHELEERNRALVETLTFNDNIVETVNVGISVVDGNGKVITWNRAMERVTGGLVTKEMILGKNLDGLPMKLRDRFVMGSVLLDTLARGVPVTAHNHVVETEDGKRRHLNVHHLPVAIGSDGTGHVITVLEDVTNNVAAHEQRVRSERLAAINETMVSVNHEVNNPLAVILGYTQMLLRQEAGITSPDDRAKWLERALRDLRKIEAEAVRIREITRKLSSLVEPVVTSYPAGDGVRMVDVNRSR